MYLAACKQRLLGLLDICNPLLCTMQLAVTSVTWCLHVAQNNRPVCSSLTCTSNATVTGADDRGGDLIPDPKHKNRTLRGAAIANYNHTAFDK